MNFLESFCDDKDISQDSPSARTPKQNVVVERKNRTLIEDTRTMLNEWAEDSTLLVTLIIDPLLSKDVLKK